MTRRRWVRWTTSKTIEVRANSVFGFFLALSIARFLFGVFQLFALMTPAYVRPVCFVYVRKVVIFRGPAFDGERGRATRHSCIIACIGQHTGLLFVSALGFCVAWF